MTAWNECVAATFHPTVFSTGAILINWFAAWWSGANSMTLIRFLLSFGGAGFTIATLNKTLFSPPAAGGVNDGKDPVRFAVAMNATVFGTGSRCHCHRGE